VGFLKQTFVACGCRYLTQCDCKPVWGGILRHCGDFGEQRCWCDVDQSSGILCDEVLRRGDRSGASSAVRVAVAQGVAASGVEGAGGVGDVGVGVAISGVSVGRHAEVVNCWWGGRWS